MDVYNMQDQSIELEINNEPFILRVTSSYKYDPKPHGVFVQIFEHDQETNQEGNQASEQILIYKAK